MPNTVYERLQKLANFPKFCWVPLKVSSPTAHLEVFLAKLRYTEIVNLIWNAPYKLRCQTVQKLVKLSLPTVCFLSNTQRFGLFWIENATFGYCPSTILLKHQRKNCLKYYLIFVKVSHNISEWLFIVFRPWSPVWLCSDFESWFK